MKCPKCGYEWKARTTKPKKCPNPKCQHWFALLVMLGLLTSACSHKPDAPAPTPQTVTSSPTPTPPPAPVTNCQNATVMVSVPIFQMPDNPVPNSTTVTINNFEQSCGDTVAVYFRNPGVPPATPWTTLHEGSNGASYFTVTNQIVTIVNHNGIVVDVDVEAVLK